jgi:putative endonuclease
MKHHVYILRSSSTDKYYIGSSENPERRLHFHNTIEKRFTSRYHPWEIAFQQEFESKQEAELAERKIKSWKSRKMIEKIIRGESSL